MDHLPLGKFNREEVYTFIAGLFVALAWYVHLQNTGAIPESTTAIDPAVLFAWLFSTGVVYIVYSTLGRCVVWRLSQRRIRAQDDDAELKKLKLAKKLAFLWADPLNETAVTSHIFALLTVALILAYHPVLSLVSFFAPSFGWLFAFHIGFTLVTIAAYVLLFQTAHYLFQIVHFVEEGYCDTLDQTTYLHERAVFFAKLKNDEYLANYERARHTQMVTTQE